MTKRPPLTHEVLIWDEHFFYGDENNCQQEALNCEWLIEHGFMPDPSYIQYSSHATYPMEWTCEDKTQ